MEIESIYQIDICSCYIKGEKFVMIPPSSSKEVWFEYKPIHPEETKGRIGFLSNHCEHIWYEMMLQAEQPSPQTLPPMDVEIGKQKEHFLTFKNPFKAGKSVKFTSKWVFAEKGEDLWKKKTTTEVTISEKDQKNMNLTRKWHVTPASFEIQPKKHKKVQIIYSPDDIEKQDRIGIEFFSEDLGLFQYECQGKGCFPIAVL